MIEPKNSIVNQYEKLFRLDDISLFIEEDVLDLIVEKALTYRLGARGLRSICETIMLDAMFDMPSGHAGKDLKITYSYAKDKLDKSNLTKLKAA